MTVKHSKVKATAEYRDHVLAHGKVADQIELTDREAGLLGGVGYAWGAPDVPVRATETADYIETLAALNEKYAVAA